MRVGGHGATLRGERGDYETRGGKGFRSRYSQGKGDPGCLVGA